MAASDIVRQRRASYRSRLKRRAGLALSLTLVGAALFGSVVYACPVCDTDTGRQVRAGIFGERFMLHVLVTLLPFPIFLGLAAAIQIWPARRGSPRVSEKVAPESLGQPNDRQESQAWNPTVPVVP